MKLFKNFFQSSEAKDRKSQEIMMTEELLWLKKSEGVGPKMLWNDIDEIRAIVEIDSSNNAVVSIRIYFEDFEMDIPRGCKGYKAFRERIYKLKDFASPNYKQALECDDPQHFILWRKEKKKSVSNLKPQKTA
jgi:hypothetical protein